MPEALLTRRSLGQVVAAAAGRVAQRIQHSAPSVGNRFVVLGLVSQDSVLGLEPEGHAHTMLAAMIWEFSCCGGCIDDCIDQPKHDSQVSGTTWSE